MSRGPITNQDWMEVIALKRQEALREGLIAGLKVALEIAKVYPNDFEAVISVRIAEMESK
jgi:hypothetical protein